MNRVNKIDCHGNMLLVSLGKHGITIDVENAFVTGFNIQGCESRFGRLEQTWRAIKFIWLGNAGE